MDLTPDNFNVKLTTHTYGGETLGRLPDGRAVFVPFALPGEEVQIQLVEVKRGYARAELVEVLTASPKRITPVCAHFTNCGGCHYQHIPYDTQLAAKRDILKDQLVRIGKIDDPPVKPTIPSPEEYYYRNNVQFHLTEQGELGFHRMRSEEVFAIKECHLPDEVLNNLWPRLDFEPMAGLQRVSLRLGNDEDILLTLESEDPEPPEFMVEDLPISAVYLGSEEVQVLAGDSYVFIDVLERSFRVSADSFFQVNTRIAAAMVEYILANLDLRPESIAIDAYAGAGLFSAFLAPRVKRLLAVEDSPSACTDFVYNLDEFDNVELYQARVEDVLHGLEVKPQVVLVDPTRIGLERRAVDGILTMRPEVLVYISCDPATLARDAQRLMEGGYQLASVTPFDLFPQTYHIESVSFWYMQ
jgi:23S rRNA (uracil1939-C5)-methyltransferase